MSNWRITIVLEEPKAYLGENKTILKKVNLEVRRGKRAPGVLWNYVIGCIKVRGD